MSNAMIWSVTAALFVVIMAAGIVLSIVTGKQQARRARALSVITGEAKFVRAESEEKRLARQRADIAKKLKGASQEENAEKKGTSLRGMIAQAGFETSILRFWLYSAFFSLIVWMLMTPTGIPGLAKVFIWFTAFLGLPRMFLNFKARRRQKKFLEEFSDALEASVRLLQAGMPVTEAIAMVAREYTGPVGEEMMQVYEDQKVGVPLGEAAERAAKRMPLTEMQMFATAIQIQSETGSSLSEVLSNLAAVIRARFRLKRKVQALSSEAKASAAIIGCLPLLVAGGLYLVNPSYIELLFITKKGKIMVTGAGMWMCVGIFIMRQMINFKV